MVLFSVYIIIVTTFPPCLFFLLLIFNFNFKPHKKEQRRVIQTKSVKYMPFLLSFANFANGIIWTTYALLKWDPFIVVIIIIVLVFFFTESLLFLLSVITYYYIYYKIAPPSPKKQSKKINIFKKGFISQICNK